MLTPEALERVKVLLEEVLEHAPEERVAFLASACGDDSAVRREVESLLTAEEMAIFDRPILQQSGVWSGLVDAVKEDEDPALSAGEMVGPYRILELLGEGGMGRVYLAERQDVFQMRVALKVLRRSYVTADLESRFANERQILAQLSHPFIARLYDGGATEDGRPFFVMEHVQGQPLDAYCQKQQLTIEKRLDLFLKICEAVQAAHRRLVVHRDLKPSNILVTDRGAPKLVDFGIAKMLDSDTDREDAIEKALTQRGERPMTLRYASPEQVESRPISTASDVYALGVVLYELLAERRLYPREMPFSALVHAICHEEPERPSSVVVQELEGSGVQHGREVAHRLRRQLMGDLDSIVLKALQKNPEKRYSSVEQLAADLRRYLDGQPVMAREGTWHYRMGKYIRRYRVPLGIAALAIGMILGLAVTAVIQWKAAVEQREEAIRQRQVAEARRNDAEVAVEAFKNLVWAALLSQQEDRQAQVRATLDRGLEVVEHLSEQPRLQAGTLVGVAALAGDLDELDLKLDLLQRAIRVLRIADGETPSLEQARAVNNLAAELFTRGDYVESEKRYREALALKTRVVSEEDVDLGKTMSGLAMTLMFRGKLDDAEEFAREALLRREESFGGDDTDVAASLRNLGSLLVLRGKFLEAEALLRQALSIRLAADLSDSVVARTLIPLGRALWGLGQYEEAEATLMRALAIREADRSEVGAAIARRDLAIVAIGLGKLEHAEGLLARARESLAGREYDLAIAELFLGVLRIRQGDFETARALLRSSSGSLVSMRGPETIYAQEAARRLREVGGLEVVN